jgi:ferredoxin-NADP reductase
MKLTFIQKTLETNNTWSFFFEPEYKLRYVAGQFIELTLPVEKPDLRGKMHWFTLSSSPTEDLLRITTRKPVGQVSSFKQCLFSLRSGDTVDSSSPMGDFVLPKDSHIPLVFIAVGIGITPFISIIDYLDATNQTRDIQLLYRTKDIADYPFKKNLEGNENIKLFMTDKHLTSESIKQTVDIKSKSLVFLAGPEEIVEKLTNEVIDHKLRRDRVVTDYFPNYMPTLTKDKS